MMNSKLFVVTADGRLFERHWRGDVWAWNDHGRPDPFGPQEIGYDWNECQYAGRAAYLQTGHRIQVRITLNPDDDVTGPEMDDLRDRWRDGIVEKWSNQFACCTAPECATRRNLTFEVLWDAPTPHHTVRVRRGPARSNQSTWDTEDTGDVASHEFGHMLGHPDEYEDGACPDRDPVGTGTVMDDNSEVAQQHCEAFCHRLGQSTTSASIA
jgi:hypothetical protein